jgi:phospholipase C
VSTFWQALFHVILETENKKDGHNKAGGAYMSEFQKLTNLQSRIKKGTRLIQTSHEDGNYVVHLTTEPPIVFDAKDESMLRDLDQI